jgi:hypothetical protein
MTVGKRSVGTHTHLAFLRARCALRGRAAAVAKSGWGWQIWPAARQPRAAAHLA